MPWPGAPGQVPLPGDLAPIGRHGDVSRQQCRQLGLDDRAQQQLIRRRIRVNTLHPGPIDNAFQARIEENIGKMAGIDATRMLNEAIPLNRHAAPEEIARSALYLASDLSSFVTASVLMADGGLRG